MTIEERVQSVLNSLDAGTGLVLLRGGLLVTLAVAVFAIYASSQFRGLRDTEAMEVAQLARNMARGEGCTTQCIRPVDLRYMAVHGKAPAKGNGYPDIRNAPLFPAILSAAFKTLRPSFSVNSAFSAYAPEKRVIVPLCTLFTLATGLMIFLIGRRLFNQRVALIAVLVFLLSDTVLADGISGKPDSCIMFLATAAIYAAVVSSEQRAKGRQRIVQFVAFIASAVLCGLAILAGYAAVALAPALAAFTAWRSRLHWSTAGLFLLIAGLTVCPWLARNRRVSGGMLGAYHYSAVADSVLYEADSLDRDPEPAFNRFKVMYAMKTKLTTNLARMCDHDMRTMGSGLIVCFFLVSFFHRFEKESVTQFRWCLALGLILLLCFSALFGAGSGGTLNILLPMAMLYGTAYFFVVAERVDFVEESWHAGLTWILVLLTALPAVLRVAGPRATIPYPPYFPPFADYVCGFLEPEETLCTDIPWATAWYGDHQSILLPRTVDDFRKLYDSPMRIGGLYLTTETGDKPYTSALRTGDDRSWLPILNGTVPAGFPLMHGIAIPPGRPAQLFLTDRVRWPAKKPSGIAESGDGELEVQASEQRSSGRL